ncbi:hypothetical protein [Nocardia niigatensis]
MARVAGAYPDIPTELIEAARAAFVEQLDGSHDVDGPPAFMRDDYRR